MTPKMKGQQERPRRKSSSTTEPVETQIEESPSHELRAAVKHVKPKKVVSETTLGESSSSNPEAAMTKKTKSSKNKKASKPATAPKLATHAHTPLPPLKKPTAPKEVAVASTAQAKSNGTKPKDKPSGFKNATASPKMSPQHSPKSSPKSSPKPSPKPSPLTQHREQLTPVKSPKAKKKATQARAEAKASKTTELAKSTLAEPTQPFPPKAAASVGPKGDVSQPRVASASAASVNRKDPASVSATSKASRKSKKAKSKTTTNSPAISPSASPSRPKRPVRDPVSPPDSARQHTPAVAPPPSTVSAWDRPPPPAPLETSLHDSLGGNAGPPELDRWESSSSLPWQAAAEDTPLWDSAPISDIKEGAFAPDGSFVERRFSNDSYSSGLQGPTDETPAADPWSSKFSAYPQQPQYSPSTYAPTNPPPSLSRASSSFAAPFLSGDGTSSIW